MIDFISTCIYICGVYIHLYIHTMYAYIIYILIDMKCVFICMCVYTYTRDVRP